MATKILTDDNYMDKKMLIHGDYLTTYRNILRLLKDNKIKDFGIYDPVDMCGTSYFPCEYIDTIDEDKGVLRVYEPSINKYHNVNILELVFDIDKKEMVKLLKGLA